MKVGTFGIRFFPGEAFSGPPPCTRAKTKDISIPEMSNAVSPRAEPRAHLNEIDFEILTIVDLHLKCFSRKAQGSIPYLGLLCLTCSSVFGYIQLILERALSFRSATVNSMTQAGRELVCSYKTGRNESKGPRPFG